VQPRGTFYTWVQNDFVALNKGCRPEPQSCGYFIAEHCPLCLPFSISLQTGLISKLLHRASGVVQGMFWPHSQGILFVENAVVQRDWFDPANGCIRDRKPEAQVNE
jgi:hypothetical protein